MGRHRKLHERIADFRARGKAEMERKAAKAKVRASRVKAGGDADDYPGTWCVYFIQVGDDGPIKIGRCSGSPLKRLDALQIGIPLDLRLVAIITHVAAQMEMDLHRRFAHLHIRGEWFRPEPDLLDYIRENALAWTLHRDQVAPWWFGLWDVRDRDMIAASLRHPERFRNDPMGEFPTYEEFQDWWRRQ